LGTAILAASSEALAQLNKIKHLRLNPASAGFFICYLQHDRVLLKFLRYVSEKGMKGKFIYKIVNTLNGKFYVGSTTNTRERFRVHRNRLRTNKHHSPHLQSAWNKYGEKVFFFHVIEVVPEESSLQEAENRWLLEHVGKEYCYNKSRYSDTPMRGIKPEEHPNYGIPKTEEQRSKISSALKAYYAEDPRNHPRFGKKHTREALLKIRQNRTPPAGENHYRYGQKLSEEVKQKIGDSQRGKPKPPGRKVSTEGLDKIKANVAAGRSHMHWLGRSHTEASKLKMSKAVKAVDPHGVEHTYLSLSQALQELGLLMPTLRRALKTGNPLVKGPRKGWSFQYLACTVS
jgi:group I intron endonuclease